MIFAQATAETASQVPFWLGSIVIPMLSAIVGGFVGWAGQYYLQRKSVSHSVGEKLGSND